jgi:hypothetical protein
MEVSGQLHDPAALHPEKETPVPTGWALEPVWTRWRGEKILASVENRTLVVQPVHFTKVDKEILVLLNYENIKTAG